MFSNCLGLKDRTLGLIGFGNVAQKVFTTAKALGLKLLVHTRTKQDALDEKLNFKYVTLD